MIFGQISNDRASIKGSPQSETATLNTLERKCSVVFFGHLVDSFELTKKYKTKTDAQTVLHHYLKKGNKSFVDFSGSYAFAILDRIGENQKTTLTLVRDRIGTKNIFYTKTPNGIVFASNLQQLFLKFKVRAILDSDGLNTMLLLGPSRPQDSGVYKNIHAVSAGHFVEYADNETTISQYYSLQSVPFEMSFDDSIEYAKEIIRLRTDSYLQSSSPIACFLSGGIDSSVLTYLYKNSPNRKSALTTISVDYKDSEHDFVANSFQPESDKNYIKIMSKFVASKHIDIILDNEELSKAIYQTAIFRGLPGMADIDSSLYLLCKNVKQHFDIALSGECADEIFGGYPWYHDISLREHQGFAWSKDLGVRTNIFDIDNNVATRFVDKHYLATLASVSGLQTDDELEKRIRELFVLNLNWFGASLLERKEMMSGAAGLQVRMPFTDHKLVEFAYNLPWALKSLDGREKGIMRQAFKGLLPDAIINRKKSPYPKSFSPIYFDFVKEKVLQIISSNSPASVLLNKSNLLKLMESDPMSQQPWYGQLMRLPQLLGYIIQLDTILKEFKVTII
ncbi:MAG: asparagine synthetase B [Clostridiales bacterium]|jgi:asparagine synthase (glutamine-hydrolysing)|nr:asparagine synthetase B [Clostridiales bacterium]